MGQITVHEYRTYYTVYRTTLLKITMQNDQRLNPSNACWFGYDVMGSMDARKSTEARGDIIRLADFVPLTEL